MIIGITGTKASGKGVIAKILEDNGFTYSSLSDCVRDEAKARGLEKHTVANLQDIGNEMREKHGNQIWATKALEKIGERENYVLDGVRNSGEIEELRKRIDTLIIGVDADQKTRYKRLIEHGRPSDPKDWDSFIEMEKRDHGEAGKNSGQQVKLCMAIADYTSWNDYNLKEKLEEDFIHGKKGFMNLIKGSKRRRPSFDENFMNEAFQWGHRSTCLRREVGSVMVKENRFISQGYNGPARGSNHCGELGGCLREKLNIPSGTRDEICRAIHGEINAILNIATREERLGSSMYVTTYPCTSCARIISNSGIKEVIYWASYNAPESEEIFKENGIDVKLYSGVSPQSYNKFWTKTNRDFIKMMK